MSVEESVDVVCCILDNCSGKYDVRFESDGEFFVYVIVVVVGWDEGWKFIKVDIGKGQIEEVGVDIFKVFVEEWDGEEVIDERVIVVISGGRGEYGGDFKVQLLKVGVFGLFVGDIAVE